MTQKRGTVLSQLAENKGLGFDGVIIQLKLRSCAAVSTIMYYSCFWADSLCLQGSIIPTKLV